MTLTELPLDSILKATEDPETQPGGQQEILEGPWRADAPEEPAEGMALPELPSVSPAYGATKCQASTQSTSPSESTSPQEEW